MTRVILPFLLGASLGLGAPALQITGGAVDDQVFQRGSRNSADILLSGTAADADGKTVEVRITRKFILVADWDWKDAGVIRQGKWTAELRGVPSGGPYRIDVRVQDSGASDSLRNILVGDLWVLAGQSNMQGVGDLVDVEPPHELVHNFDMSDHWAVAEEPLHRLVDAVDRVHWSRNPQTKEPERYEGERLRKYIAERRKGTGLGLPFAVEMVKQTGIPIGLLSCAHGGTSMDQWNPALKDQGGDSLYSSMVRRVRAAGGKVAGVLWYQGESDASPKAAPEFQAKFERFIAAVREDFGQPDLPFYYVQIGRHVADTNQNEWNLVQEGQRIAEGHVARTGMAPAVDLSLDDGIHVGTQDLKRLGRRLANLALGRTKRGPRPLSAVYGDGMVRIVFSDVNERLVSKGRIAGFSIHNASGAAVPLIYKVQVDPVDGNAVILFVGGKLPEGATLRYGAGRDPYCNLTDEADMAAPVFGPLAIQ